MMNRQQIRGDLYGGIIAAIIALPLALGFGLQSGLGPEAGLYSAIVLGLIATLFGGTSVQISGPTGPMTVVSSVVIVTAMQYYGALSQAIGLILATFFLAGLFQIVLGLFKIGNYIRYIPMPVISGFMTGIGIIVILYQVPIFFGFPAAQSTLDIITGFDNTLSAINVGSMLLGLFTLMIIMIAKPWNHYVPSSMLALIVGTLLSLSLPFDVGSVVGDIPSGFHFVDLHSFFAIKSEYITFMIISALTLAGLGAVDSLLTSVIVDRMTNTRHKSNKELIGQGLGNMLTAMVGGLPGAGATMRTVANVHAGGTTRLSGVTHSILLLMILFGLGQFISYIPVVVLSAILVDVGFKIIDSKSLRLIAYLPRTDVVIMLVVVLLTVFVNLLNAIAAGMILSAVFLMKNLYELSLEKTISSSMNDLVPQECDGVMRDEVNIFRDDIYIKSIHGPIFWGFSEDFRKLITSKKMCELVIDLGGLHHIDQTGLFSLHESVQLLASEKIVMYLINVQKQPLDLLQKTGFIPDYISDDKIFGSFAEFVTYVQQRSR